VAENTRATEETKNRGHSPFGGLGSVLSQPNASNYDRAECLGSSLKKNPREGADSLGGTCDNRKSTFQPLSQIKEGPSVASRRKIRASLRVE